jgi:hypothetical protein
MLTEIWMVTITCKYSCALCGLKRVAVEIPMRASDETAVHWMEQLVIPNLVADHEQRSPACHPETLSELLIPMAGADYIGGPPVQ